MNLKDHYGIVVVMQYVEMKVEIDSSFLLLNDQKQRTHLLNLKSYVLCAMCYVLCAMCYIAQWFFGSLQYTRPPLRDIVPLNDQEQILETKNMHQMQT